MKYVVKTYLLVTLIGLSLSVKAQGPLADPLDGILVTSYTASGSVQSPFSPASLTLEHTDNSEFDGSLIFGDFTGDYVVGTDWELHVVAADYDEFIPGLGMLLGTQIESNSGDFQLGDTQTISFGLTFSKGQYFRGVNPPFANLINTTPTSATLTPIGGSSVDLLNTATYTLFTTGDYVLSMEGVLSTVDSSSALVAQFTAIPEPSIIAFILIGLMFFTKTFRARKR